MPGSGLHADSAHRIPPMPPQTRRRKRLSWPNPAAQGPRPGATAPPPPVCRQKAQKGHITIRHASRIHPYPHAIERNGHMESFHSAPIRECIWPHDPANCLDAERVIPETF